VQDVLWCGKSVKRKSFAPLLPPPHGPLQESGVRGAKLPGISICYNALKSKTVCNLMIVALNCVFAKVGFCIFGRLVLMRHHRRGANAASDKITNLATIDYEPHFPSYDIVKIHQTDPQLLVYFFSPQSFYFTAEKSGKMVLAKSKNAVGLGNSLMNDRFGKGKGLDQKKATSSGIRRTNHTTGEKVSQSK
jgi:hypothetical protein